MFQWNAELAILALGSNYMKGDVTLDSILNHVKKNLGIDVDYDEFDVDVITHINMALSVLQQIGFGKPLFITNSESKWTDITDNPIEIGMLQTYVYLKVRVVFDPPTSSVLMNAMNEQIKELEWRLHGYGNYSGGAVNE